MGPFEYWVSVDIKLKLGVKAGTQIFIWLNNLYIHKGERTHPCGEPVLETRVLDKTLFTKTRCVHLNYLNY